MADDLHDCTLVLEFFKLVLLDNLLLDLLDSHDGVLPAAFIYETVTTLRYLLVISDRLEGNLVILDEGTGFVGEKGRLIASTVLL